MPRGRPSRYSRALSDRICLELSKGRTLSSICRDEKMPDESTVRGWALDDRDGFFPRYARARDIGADCFMDQTIDIADTPNKSQRVFRKVDAEGRPSGLTEVVIVDATERDRMRIDARKFYSSRIAPKRWSDRQPQLDESGGRENDNMLKDLANAIRNSPPPPPGETKPLSPVLPLTLD